MRTGIHRTSKLNAERTQTGEAVPLTHYPPPTSSAGFFEIDLRLRAFPGPLSHLYLAAHVSTIPRQE
jgi:hypothetical protein